MTQLETARLILRPPCREDYDPWLAFGADAEVQRHLGGVLPPTYALVLMQRDLAREWTDEAAPAALTWRSAGRPSPDRNQPSLSPACGTG